MLWFMEKKNLHQPVKKDQRTYGNTHKITTGQADDYTTDSLLDYVHFKNCYKIISIELTKQQALDANRKQNDKLILLEIYNQQEIQQCF